MKNLIIIASLLLSLPIMAQTKVVKKNAVKANNFGITYSLPKTSLVVDAEVTKVTCKAGPYYKYAEKYLGVKDAITEDKVYYELGKISLVNKGVPDADNTFIVEFKAGTVAPYAYLTEDGLLCSINAEYTPNESALEAAKEIQELANVTFAEGYQDEKDEVVEALQSEAVKAAEEADVAVLFLGLPDNFESEGYDRKHMNLPNCQNELVEKVLEVQKHVVVVLHNGSAVLMPWKDQVEGILEVYLGGEAVGKAVAEVLVGRKNPSGRLAETFPLRLEDTPCYLTYGKGYDNAEYQEGVFVGYRYYTSRKMETAFPFGHGLSYTTFEYSDFQIDKKKMSDKDTVEVSVKVKNTGNRAGKTVVQLYVEAPETEVVRPVRELRGFEKISLEEGEEKTVTFTLDERAFAYWNTLIHDWYVEEGTYKVMIGENADQMCVGEEITVHPTKELPKTYSLNTCLGELMRDPKAQAVMGPFMQGMAQNDAADMAEAQKNDTSGAVNQEMMAAMMEGMPLRQLLSFVPGIKREMLEQMVNALNQL